MRRLLPVLGLALAAANASAAPPTPDLKLHTLPAERPSREDPTFQYDLKYELPATALLIGAWVGADMAKGKLAPAECRWCERNAGGSTVNRLDGSIRDAVKMADPRVADMASSIIGYGLLPVAALGLDLIANAGEGGFRRWAVDLMMIAEASATAAGLTSLAKFTVGRARPYTQDRPAGAAGTPEDNLSFFSGHTSFAFAVAVSAATIATMRHSRWAPVVWTVGLALAAATGYLRIAADKHYFSDVLTGAAIGSAVGFAVPWLHKKSWGKKLPGLAGGRFPEGGGYATATWSW